MLNAETIATIKQTAPVLATEGEAITRLFYSKLFGNHPELQNVFNMAHQAQGEQPKALAESVFRYASHIDQLQALGPDVRRIAHKHASLAVTPEQYPIVGKYLLEAIGEHLDLPADHAIIQAWAAAYGQLADILIDSEEQIYAQNETRPGGWRGFRPFRVARVEDEAAGVSSLYLEAEDGAAIADFLPGQYVGLKIETPPGEYEEIRQYSLSCAPGQGYYRITVKAEANDPSHPGRVSHHLHQASAGTRVLLQPPTGDFVLPDSERDLVLIAGGVGITPLLSMLEARLAAKGSGAGITFIHCCRDRAHHIMGDQLRALAAETGFAYHVAYEFGDGADYTGYLDAAVLRDWITERDAEVCFCGPRPFMAALNRLLQDIGFAEERLHYELFGPSTRL